MQPNELHEDLFSLVDKQIKHWNTTIPKENWGQFVIEDYYKITSNHIHLVKCCANYLVNCLASEVDKLHFRENVLKHDSDKLNGTSEFIANYAVNCMCYYKDEEEYSVTDESASEYENLYWPMHYNKNGHHPEYWAHGRTTLTGQVDASTMPVVYLAEMVADWMAVGIVNKNSAKSWWDKQRGVKWYFTKEQEEFIDKCIEIESILLGAAPLNPITHQGVLKEMLHEDDATPVLSQEGIISDAFSEWWGHVKEAEETPDKISNFLSGILLVPVFTICNYLGELERKKEDKVNAFDWKKIRSEYSKVCDCAKRDLKDDSYLTETTFKLVSVKDYITWLESILVSYKEAERIPDADMLDDLEGYQERFIEEMGENYTVEHITSMSTNKLTFRQAGYFDLGLLGKLFDLYSEVNQYCDRLTRRMNDFPSEVFPVLEEAGISPFFDEVKTSNRVPKLYDIISQIERIVKYVGSKTSIEIKAASESISSSTEAVYKQDSELNTKIDKTTKTFKVEDFVKEMQPGDILVTRRHNGRTMSKYMAWTQSMPYASIKIVGRDKKKVYGMGVRLDSMNFHSLPTVDFLNTLETALLIRPFKKITSTQLNTLLKWLETNDGKIKYDFIAALKSLFVKHLGPKGVTNNTTNVELKTLFCSSLVAKAFADSGIELGIKDSMMSVVWPKDFVFNPLLKSEVSYFKTKEVFDHWFGEKQEASNEALTVSTEALDPNLSDKRKKIISLIVKTMDLADPSKMNGTRWKTILSNMSDKQFDEYMKAMKDKKTQMHILAPNLKMSLQNNDLLAAADSLGLEIFHRIWFKDSVTGKRYLTDNKYMVLQLPIRRQQQFLDEKISVPDNDKSLDGLTGQVTGDSRACSITNPEIQILAARGLDNTLAEFVQVRGGDMHKYAEFKRQLEEKGSAELATLDPNSRTRVSVMANVLLKGMMLDPNI